MRDLRSKLTETELIERMSLIPAKIFGLPGGTIAPGSIADVTVIDPETILAVDKNAFYSKGKNTPYHGRLLSGWPVLTVVEGEVVMENRVVKE